MHQPVSAPSSHRSPGTELVAIDLPGRDLKQTAAECPADRHGDTIQRLNTSYLLAAREVARESVLSACAVFGVTSELANWLASATIEEVLGLASLRICLFSLRLPARALARSHCASRQVPLPLVAMHAALSTLSDG
ncbi:flagellar transcriptional regulator FlhD [uncultured Thiodictyon sp.]|uniref:flagellar transcriptional regulator FlhD n=1 Tax=uncultured Thiodictyon sp. TaxID=1846217 RepID=UPI0025D4A1D1|nr:flagellar transcriptional regulator FlhD [uncultured Thiodictyon sp.]